MDHVVFLSVAEVLRIHRRIIADFGGEDGLRDRGLLESAVAMPHAMFDGAFLHPDLATMAAAYHFHLCANHPFVDGNKRVREPAPANALTTCAHPHTCMRTSGKSSSSSSLSRIASWHYY